MVRLKLVIENLEPLQFTKEPRGFIPDIDRLWREQRAIARTEKRHPQFAPLDQVVRAINFVAVSTERMSRRDKILLYGAMQEAFETEDQAIIVPLCYFNEEKLVKGTD